MNRYSISSLKGCYIMQRGDIQRFASTLADGFSQYSMFNTFATEPITMT